MARNNPGNLTSVSEPELDISSLIDVCFLLLIYFLVATTLVPQERDLGLGLPRGYGEPTSPSMPPMTIRIDASGAVFSGTGLSEQPLDTDPDSRKVPLLAGQLALYRDAARAAGDEPKIFFRVDQNARQQRVIDVLDAFAVAGILSVAFEDLAPL